MMARWTVDMRPATWRSRAMRYMLIYLLLSMVLVGARYATQEVRPSLLAVQTREAELLAQRDELELKVQMLSSPQRIREWALAGGMRRFAEVPKVAVEIAPLPQADVPAASGRTGVEVRTQWR